MSEMQPFDATETSLERGVNLIEASAGTGKTFAIAWLVLRFVAEKGIPLENLLVVTFTKAATEELKIRIHQRLHQAFQLLSSLADKAENEIAEGLAEALIADSALVSWCQRLSSAQRQQAKQALEQALLSIDQASIQTIHGFCQSALREYSLESGHIFEANLSSDLQELTDQVVADYWRQTIYSLPLKQAALLLGSYDCPSALQQSIAQVQPEMPLLSAPVSQAFSDLSAQLESQRESVIAAWQTAQDQLTPYLTRYNGNKVRAATLQANWHKLSRYLSGQSRLADDKLKRFLTFEFWEQAEKTAHKGTTLGLGIDFTVFEQWMALEKSLLHAWRLELHHSLAQQVAERARAQNRLSFDDLIRNLDQALRADNAPRLIAALRQRYTVALIDEFQDTDAQQWSIFETLFANQSVEEPAEAFAPWCFLIGDPKQAIYKFRGADIFAYFKAKSVAKRHFSLASNWRSHPKMVAAVNRLFLGEQTPYSEPFLLNQLQFHPVRPAKTAEDGGLWLEGEDLSGLQVDYFLPEAGNWQVGTARQRIRQQTLWQVLHWLQADYQIRQSVDASTTARAVEPKDIAILVRTKGEGKWYQTQLARLGVPCSLSFEQSVFQSDAVYNLAVLLQAIAYPADVMLAKKALALDWFGLDGLAYWQVLQAAPQFEAWLNLLQLWHHSWQAKGGLVMLKRLLNEPLPFLSSNQTDNLVSLQTLLMRLPLAERVLTDIWHAMELMQQAALEGQFGLHKSLDWFMHQAQEGRGGDQAQLRLESDEKSLKILTMHAAKGLEFPLVICPDLLERQEGLQKQSQQLIFHDEDKGQRVADIGSERFEQHKAQALHEELAELVRLLYVALTRSRFVCVMPWADVYKGKAKAPVQSGLSRLVAHFGSDAQQVSERLAQLIEEGIRLNRCDAEPPKSLVPYQAGMEARHLQLASRPKVKGGLWRISSYSALNRGEGQKVLADPVFQDQDEALTEANDPPDSLASISAISTPAADTQLPKGAKFGTLVHDCLERNGFSDIAAGTERYQNNRDLLLTWAAFDFDANQLAQLDQLLRQTVQGRVFDWSLESLAFHQVQKEMDFYLALPNLNIQALNAFLRDQPDCHPIAAQQLEGYLTGSIDLVCEQAGRFYLADYKSNYLDDYSADHLAEAMLSHNYGLQYWIYALALHLYLKQRVAHYQFDQHFGGVAYLFVRGMRPDCTSGIYQTELDWADLVQFAGCLGVDLE